MEWISININNVTYYFAITQDGYIRYRLSSKIKIKDINGKIHTFNNISLEEFINIIDNNNFNTNKEDINIIRTRNK